MIRCYWSRTPACPRPAVSVIVVKRGGKVIWFREACTPHHQNAWHEAMEFSKGNGGSLSSARIDIPVRKSKERLINVNSVIPRAEHAAMVVVAQTLRMSQREFIRAAINNQVRLFTKGEGNDVSGS